MALFHLSVTQTKRSAGQSAIASAAYRAGERLYSEYYGEYSDYTRKGGVICSDILLPSHAPPEYADRQTLWNAVEKAERGKNAQLAYSFDIALQNEFSLEENIALARQFLLENFVSRGMVVDFAVHQPDREDGGIPNPHFHVLCPIRPIEQNGKWGLKQRRVYELDEDGNRIRDANGKFVFNAVPTTDWGSPETLEHWRQTWAELCNAKFAEKGLDVRIDHRSYERQGVDLLPTIHEGATVRAILQSQSQLKAIYKDNADTIVGNCDTTLFLGGKEKTTLKEISEILGKETIDSFNTSETRGRELSHGLNYQKLGKQLMTEDEIAVMDGGKCILQLRGVRPFFSDKFDITKHPKYKYLSDADPKNAFDMEKHLKRRPAIVKPDEVFDYYEIDAADLQEDADHEET